MCCCSGKTESYLIYIWHNAKKALYNHECFVHHASLVHISSSYRFKHRNFIFGLYMCQRSRFLTYMGVGYCKWLEQQHIQNYLSIIQNMIITFSNILWHETSNSLYYIEIINQFYADWVSSNYLITFVSPYAHSKLLSIYIM